MPVSITLIEKSDETVVAWLGRIRLHTMGKFYIHNIGASGSVDAYLRTAFYLGGNIYIPGFYNLVYNRRSKNEDEYRKSK